MSSIALDFRGGQRKSLNHRRSMIRSTAQNARDSHVNHLIRRQMTPSMINLYNLKKILEMYTAMGITKELRDIWSKEMAEMEDVRYLNMEHPLCSLRLHFVERLALFHWVKLVQSFAWQIVQDIGWSYSIRFVMRL